MIVGSNVSTAHEAILESADPSAVITAPANIDISVPPNAESAPHRIGINAATLKSPMIPIQNASLTGPPCSFQNPAISSDKKPRNTSTSGLITFHRFLIPFLRLSQTFFHSIDANAALIFPIADSGSTSDPSIASKSMSANLPIHSSAKSPASSIMGA